MGAFSKEQKEEIRQIVRSEIKKVDEQNSSTIDPKLLAEEVTKIIWSRLDADSDSIY